MFVSKDNLKEIKFDVDVKETIKCYIYNNSIEEFVSKYLSIIKMYSEVYKSEIYEKLINDFQTEIIYVPFNVVYGKCTKIYYTYDRIYCIPHDVDYKVTEEYVTYDSIQDENGYEIGRENEQTHEESYIETRTEYEEYTEHRGDFMNVNLHDVVYTNPHNIGPKTLEKFKDNKFEEISFDFIKTSNLKFIPCEPLNSTLRLKLKNRIEADAIRKLKRESVYNLIGSFDYKNLSFHSLNDFTCKEEIIYVPIAILKTFDSQIFEMDCFSKEIKMNYLEQTKYLKENVKNDIQKIRLKSMEENKKAFINASILNMIFLVITILFSIYIFMTAFYKDPDYIDLIYGLFTKRYYSGNPVAKYIFEYGLITIAGISVIFYFIALFKLRYNINKIRTKKILSSEINSFVKVKKNGLKRRYARIF